MDLTQQPIIIVDDDADDLELIDEAYGAFEHFNKLILFRSGDKLFEYLTNPANEAPFFILCDINMPKDNGFAIREKLMADQQVKYKSVPFLLWSTTAVDSQVKKAYDTMI